jgi:hypothetical protein
MKLFFLLLLETVHHTTHLSDYKIVFNIENVVLKILLSVEYRASEVMPEDLILDADVQYQSEEMFHDDEM